MQTSDYLNSLQNDKEALAIKLSEKGVTLNGNETFTELIPKLDEIQSGGDISEYFYETINSSQTIIDLIRKVPMFIFNGTNMTFMFQNSKAEEIDLSGVGNNVNNMSGTFRYCSKLKKIIGLNDLNTSKVTNISNIFWQRSFLLLRIFNKFEHQ